MPRPRIEKEKRRVHVVKVRLSDEEFKALTDICEFTSSSMSKVLRVGMGLVIRNFKGKKP